MYKVDNINTAAFPTYEIVKFPPIQISDTIMFNITYQILKKFEKKTCLFCNDFLKIVDFAMIYIPL